MKSDFKYQKSVVFELKGTKKTGFETDIELEGPLSYDEIRDTDKIVVLDIYFRLKDQRTCIVMPCFESDQSKKHQDLVRSAKMLNIIRRTVETSNEYLEKPEKMNWVVTPTANSSANKKILYTKTLESIFESQNRFGIPIGRNEAVTMIEFPNGRLYEINAVEKILKYSVPLNESQLF